MPSELADTHAPSLGPVRDAVSSGRFRWWFAPIADDLAGAIRQIPWEDLASCPGASRVKEAGNRDVWRIDLPGRTIYAKCYRSQGYIKQMLERIRGLAAKREWLALRRAADVGVLAPDALAYAARGSGSAGAYSAMLITAAMPAGAQSLDAAWLAAQGLAGSALVRRQGQLIEALAELLARAHVGGLFHRDLHVGNILIFPHNGSVTAAMIDLHNANLCKGIHLAGVRSNLVQLNQWFARHASRTVRLRFLAKYCRELRKRLSASQCTRGIDSSQYGYKPLAQHVLKVSHGYAARLHTKRDRRILKRNKYFTTLALPGGWSARLVLDIKHGRPYHHPLDELPDKKGWREMLADPVALLASEGVRVLKRSGSRQVVQVDCCFGGEPWAIVAKHERGGSWLGWVAGWFGRNPLRREFVTGWWCLHRELPVALPVAFLTRQEGAKQESILLVEYITDSRDLDTVVRMHLPEMTPAEIALVKRGACKELATTLRRMWACKLAHRDLKAANIRVQIPRGNLAALKIVLVDVDGIRPVRWQLRKAVLRSLARLDASFANCPMVTRTDRLRLLLAVLRGIDGGQPDWKDAWRRIRHLSLRDQAVIAKQLPWLRPIVHAAGAE